MLKIYVVLFLHVFFFVKNMKAMGDYKEKGQDAQVIVRENSCSSTSSSSTERTQEGFLNEVLGSGDFSWDSPIIPPAHTFGR